MGLQLTTDQAETKGQPMTDTATISENFSETPKRKRGRPRGHQRNFMEELPPMLRADGCTRTLIDTAFAAVTMQVVQNTDADTQRAVWGCTGDDIRDGTRNLPKGWKTAAVSIGKYLEATDDDPARVAGIVAEARRDGISFGDIAAHFRRLRLGDREGNAHSLTMALARALDEYRKRFPKTTDQQERDALQQLWLSSQDE